MDTTSILTEGEIDEYVARLGENRSHFLYTTALKVIRSEIPEATRHKTAKRKGRGKG